MPELPDVEVFRRYADSTSLRQKIEGVDVTDAGVVEGASAKRLASATKGAEFVSTRRHGKRLFVELRGADDWLELHFGMTGSLKYYKKDDDAPEHARVIFRFKNGSQLAYVSQRKLGHLSLIDDPDERVRSLRLGPDALDEGRDFDVFCKAYADARGSIKGALMAQDKLAGIGNVYGDEILYHAHIHPQSSAPALKEKDLRSLHRATIKVLETAVEREVDAGRMPRTWLLPHREEGASCPRCKGNLKTAKVSGRTSYFCDSCQERKY